MPAIPIYTSSPINAAKASGVTPKTSAPAADGGSSSAGPQEVTATATATPTSQNTSKTSYPPPQPGAVPSASGPTPKRTSRSYAPSPYAPTGPDGVANPPPPQPGALPTAPGRTSSIPPPPKAGESASVIAQSPPVTTVPPQMHIPPPTMSHSQGSSTSTAFPGPAPAGPRPAMLPTGSVQELSHPPGYQQAPAPAPSMREWSDGNSEDDDGVWDAAKKWARDAGGKVAAAESEVWRRINHS